MMLGAAQIEEAVRQAGLEPIEQQMAAKFGAFAELLLRWNAKMNLTAIRTPAGILQHHFLECIFCAQQLPQEACTLLDFGSGAGFPGVPIAICRPEMRVTLAESQGKKAAFLREAVRTLRLDAAVFAARVETMAPASRFDVVAMRAVDKMEKAMGAAALRVAEGGWLVLLSTAAAEQSGLGGELDRFEVQRAAPVPGSARRELRMLRHVPRGTT